MTRLLRELLCTLNKLKSSIAGVVAVGKSFIIPKLTLYEWKLSLLEITGMFLSN